ncbi:MAG: S8 family serine peptidase [Alphaproteobacteria bacterium]|nr:S8 family serine peptidase [Alphaproteobacteria bacterium]
MASDTLFSSLTNPPGDRAATTDSFSLFYDSPWYKLFKSEDFETSQGANLLKKGESPAALLEGLKENPSYYLDTPQKFEFIFSILGQNPTYRSDLRVIATEMLKTDLSIINDSPDLARVKTLLSFGEVTGSISSFLDPLFIQFKEGRFEIAQEIIDSGYDISALIKEATYLYRDNPITQKKYDFLIKNFPEKAGMFNMPDFKGRAQTDQTPVPKEDGEKDDTETAGEDNAHSDNMPAPDPIDPLPKVRLAPEVKSDFNANRPSLLELFRSESFKADQGRALLEQGGSPEALFEELKTYPSQKINTLEKFDFIFSILGKDHNHQNRLHNIATELLDKELSIINDSPDLARVKTLLSFGEVMKEGSYHDPLFKQFEEGRFDIALAIIKSGYDSSEFIREMKDGYPSPIDTPEKFDFVFSTLSKHPTYEEHLPAIATNLLKTELSITNDSPDLARVKTLLSFGEVTREGSYHDPLFKQFEEGRFDIALAIIKSGYDSSEFIREMKDGYRSPIDTPEKYHFMMTNFPHEKDTINRHRDNAYNDVEEKIRKVLIDPSLIDEDLIFTLKKYASDPYIKIGNHNSLAFDLYHEEQFELAQIALDASADKETFIATVQKDPVWNILTTQHSEFLSRNGMLDEAKQPKMPSLEAALDPIPYLDKAEKKLETGENPQVTMVLAESSAPVLGPYTLVEKTPDIQDKHLQATAYAAHWTASDGGTEPANVNIVPTSDNGLIYYKTRSSLGETEDPKLSQMFGAHVVSTSQVFTNWTGANILGTSVEEVDLAFDSSRSIITWAAGNDKSEENDPEDQILNTSQITSSLTRAGTILAVGETEKCVIPSHSASDVALVTSNIFMDDDAKYKYEVSPDRIKSLLLDNQDKIIKQTIDDKFKYILDSSKNEFEEHEFWKRLDDSLLGINSFSYFDYSDRKLLQEIIDGERDNAHFNQYGSVEEKIQAARSTAERIYKASIPFFIKNYEGGYASGYDDKGFIKKLYGTSFAAPASGGMLAEEFGEHSNLHPYVVFAASMMSAAPIKSRVIEDNKVDIPYIKTAANRLFAPQDAGFGILDRKRFGRYVNEFARMAQADPEAAEIGRPIRTYAEGQVNDDRTVTFTIPQDTTVFRVMVSLYTEDGDEYADPSIKSPSGTMFKAHGKLMKEMKGVKEMSINHSATNGFFGENSEGKWTVYLPDDFDKKISRARLTVVGIKKGTIIDQALDGAINEGEMPKPAGCTDDDLTPVSTMPIVTAMPTGSWTPSPPRI